MRRKTSKEESFIKASVFAILRNCGDDRLKMRNEL